IAGYGRRGSTIEGPVSWFHPVLMKNIKVYKRERKSKIQYFVLNALGIGRVFDFRRKNKGKIRYYDGTNIKFPAGDNWKINSPRSVEYKSWRIGDSMCLKEQIRIHSVNVEKVSFDECGNLVELISTFSINSKLDHRYWFKPNKGMVKSKKLSKDKKK
ncbi:hypothetical protein N9N67_08020, partial [Bacteriovoracaceae bacterium]|nr:hypothetical protein [Bacteriovoracaceae bacterium]